jgi:hypothetical protein
MSSDTTSVSSPPTPACQAPTTVTLSLGRCQAGIADAYCEITGQVIRTDSPTPPEASRSGGPRMARVAALGLGGALAGSGIYYAVLGGTGYEIGLVALAAGWLVTRGGQQGPDGGGTWGTRLSPRG